MENYLVILSGLEPEHNLVFNLPEHGDRVSTISLDQTNAVRSDFIHNYDELKIIKCPEASVENVKDYLTRLWPGRDVSVYKMTEMSQRPAGNRVDKLVTEKGVIPK